MLSLLIRSIPTIVLVSVGVISLCSPPDFPVLKPVPLADRRQQAKTRAVEYFVQARHLERQGRDDEALECYETAYKIDPASSELRNQLVRKYIEAGRFPQALLLVKGKRSIDRLDGDEKRTVAGIYLKAGELFRTIEIFESLADKKEDDYLILARIRESVGDVQGALRDYETYYRRNGASLELGLKIVGMELLSKRIDAADSLLSRIAKRHGEKASLYDMRGVIALARGDTSGALSFFNKAIAVDSTYDEGLRNAARVYLQRNDYPSAVACYEALYANSEIYKAVYGRTLAILYYYNRQYDRAEAMITMLLGRASDDEELHFYQGLVLDALGKPDLARVELEKAVALRGDYDDAWRELCFLSIRAEDLDRALASAGRYTAAFPESVSAWSLLGHICNLRKEYDRASSSFLKAVAIDSTNASAWFELGGSYERKKDIRRAADAFRRVLRLRPKDPAASNFLAYMWAERGMQLDSAKLLLESALAREPDNGAYLDSYAWVLHQKGDDGNAIEYMRRAIRREHGDPVIFEHLGDILVRLGEFEGAARAYRKSLDLGPERIDDIRKKIIGLEPRLRVHEVKK